MNDDLVVSKILKLLENNTAFIGYALNGGIGTKINVRNTETGKTIQALSINVDSSGEVLVVKDSEDNQYKAVTFKTSEQVTERIIQIRKTKPIDDKKTIEYTDSDIEVFYLFVKLIDTGSPVPTQLQSTWIRKGSSCTQFVGAYERCNYAATQTISGTSYRGLPYVPYSTLNECLNDDLGRDAKTPHGTKDANGANAGWKYFSTKISQSGEASMKAALESHDAQYGTSYKKLFGYGSIIECSGAMNLQGWEAAYNSQTGQNYIHCEFSYFPGYTVDCTPAMQAAGYCDSRGFISSKAPLLGQESPGMPSVGGVDNSWGHIYGWKDLSYEFMYKRHFGQLYLNGSTAPGSFYILEVNEDQVPPNLPSGYFPWTPGCPGNAPNGGPYDGSGGNRFPDGVAPISKRDMKLSTHKAEIWLGSSKKTEAIKLYELGVSDLFSGMYNALIMQAEETRVDSFKRLNVASPNTDDEVFIHNIFYQNRDKNRLDLLLDPKVWIYVVNNVPRAGYLPQEGGFTNLIQNSSVQDAVTHLYNRTLNISIVDNKTQIIHLKLGLKPANNLSNTDCKGAVNSGFGYSYPNPDTGFYCGQSWEYQKYITIKVKNWSIESTTNTLNLTDIDASWKRDYISRKFLTSFGTRYPISGTNITQFLNRELPTRVFLRPTASVNLIDVLDGNNYEQWNYSVAKRLGYIGSNSYYYSNYNQNFYIDSFNITPQTTYADRQRKVGLGTYSWWELWDKSNYDNETKRLSSVVGYERNFHQIVNSYGLGSTLDYSSSSISQVITGIEYYEYLENLPQKYVPSTINQVRKSIIPSNVFPHLKSREVGLNNTGLNFFFSDFFPRWSAVYTHYLQGFTPVYQNYYSSQNQYASTTTYEYLSRKVQVGGGRNRGFRFNTLMWINNLWAQLVYDTKVVIDIDSYKDVEFNLYTPLNKYIKHTPLQTEASSEYSFVTIPAGTTNVDTVLSPGVLDITKQVPIKKPTNVELDPNMSFLVYLYPFCTVTKKTKEI